MSLVISRADKKDIESMMINIRQCDLDEMYALTDMNLVDRLNYSFNYSTHIWSGYEDEGNLLGIFGVGPVGSMVSGRGCPWFIGTTYLDKYPRAMLQLPRPYLDEMRQAYPEMMNFVWSQNLPAIRWIKWLGFTVEPPQPIGYRNELFHLFRMTSHV